MSLELEIIKQELKIARKHLVDKNVENVNIIANRIMTDLLVADRNEKILITIGWILREISHEMNIIIAYGDKSKSSNALNEAITFLDKIIEMVAKNEHTELKIYEIYFNYQKRVRIYRLPTPDDTIYTIKPEFTRKFNLMLIKHLLDNRKLLLQENNKLIKGCLNGFSRFIKEHGAMPADLILHQVLTAFNSYYNYTLYSEIGLDGKIKNVESLESKLSSYIESIEKMVPMMDGDLEVLCKYSVDIIIELSIEFRKNNINYSFRVPSVEKKIELPEEAKKKIGETIAKAFEEQAV